MSNQPTTQNGDQPGGETLSAFRRKRIWLTLGLPLLVVAGIAIAVRTRPVPPPAPSTPLVTPAATPAPDPSELDDTVVRNIPRILIDPSIALTTRPPDIVEAVTTLEDSRTWHDDNALEAARAELEEGTLFLERKVGRAPAPPPVATPDTSAEDLARAEESLIQKSANATPAVRDIPATTNTATPR